MGKELSICKVQSKLYKDEVMWSADPYCVVQDSYTELQSRNCGFWECSAAIQRGDFNFYRSQGSL